MSITLVTRQSNVEPINNHGLPAIGERVWFDPDGDDLFPPEIRNGAEVEVIAHYNPVPNTQVAVFAYKTGGGHKVAQAMAPYFHPLPDARQAWIRKTGLFMDSELNLPLQDCIDAAQSIHDAIAEGTIEPPEVDQ